MRGVIIFFKKSLCYRLSKRDVFNVVIYYYVKECSYLAEVNQKAIWDRAEKRDDNRKGKNALRYIIFIVKISKFQLQYRLPFFSMQTK